MILIRLDRTKIKPLYRQILQHLIFLIQEGALKPGQRLPASRKLASELGVNRTTVTKAYAELWAAGYLESRPGSYSIVRKRVPAALPEKQDSRSILFDPKIFSNKTVKAADDLKIRFVKKYPAAVDFASLSPDPELMPSELLRKSMNDVLHTEGQKILGYGDPYGYKPLREWICARMRQHGISLDYRNILITYGAQNALEYILKLLTHNGSGIASESPIYSSAIPLFKYYAENIFPVNMLADGLDLDALQLILKTKHISCLYTIPNFQNPTGITTSQAHREELLRLCRTFRVPIIEDGFEEEMKYFDRPVLPIKSMDHDGCVFYVGTFSKVLCPGIRTGWIAADRVFIDQLAAVKQISSISGSQMDEAVLHHFCRSGGYELHLRRMQRIYRKRMHTALRILREELDDDRISHTRPMGGYTIWFELKSFKCTEEELIAKIADTGTAVCPGRVFYIEKPAHITFRLSIAHTNEEQIETGIKNIIKVLKQERKR